MKTVELVIACLLTSVCHTETARILAVFPTPSISHQVVFRPLTQELARRGHHVTVVTTDPVNSKEPDLVNLTEIDLHEISYSPRDKALTDTYGQDRNIYSQIFVLAQTLTNIFDDQLKSKGVQALLERSDDYYDLLILEACVRPALVFSHVFKAPIIQISSLGGMLFNYEALGVPIHPLAYFTTLRQKLYNLSMWDKLMELKVFVQVYYAHHICEGMQNAMLQRHFGPTVPVIGELNNNIDMLFLATNPIWAGNTPVPPSVVFIGGIHLNTKEVLGKDLKEFLDSAKNGVIYVSFGTNVQTNELNTGIINIFVKVFSQLNLKVVWKCDEDLFYNQTNDIKIMKWLPQSTLLHHPKVKLFITQGGLQSTDEAIAAGVPLLGIPILADQWYNTEQYVHLNIGMKLSYNDLKEEQLREAIDRLTRDESYRRNVGKLRSQIQDLPQSPLESAIWWTEHVLRNGGGRHLRSPFANMYWYENFGMELLVLLAITSFILYIVLRILFKSAFNCFLSVFKNIKGKK